MHLLFPSDPFNKAAADEAYVEELEAACALGIPYSLFSFEDFEAGGFKPLPLLSATDAVLYRGWMLAPEGYSRLYQAVSAKGGSLRTNPTQYRHCHYLPEWYPLCEEFTPETIFLAKDADFASELAVRIGPPTLSKISSSHLRPNAVPSQRRRKRLP